MITNRRPDIKSPISTGYSNGGGDPQEWARERTVARLPWLPTAVSFQEAQMSTETPA